MLFRKIIIMHEAVNTLVLSLTVSFCPVLEISQGEVMLVCVSPGDLSV